MLVNFMQDSDAYTKDGQKRYMKACWFTVTVVCNDPTYFPVDP